MIGIRKMIIVLWATAVFLVACGGSGDMEVSNVWGRNSPAAAANGAFYMTITNKTGADDRLLSASADVCAVVELHEMYMRENDVMGMRQVLDGYIPLPQGQTVELKVGGLHVMCIDKQQEFMIGDKIPLTLEFEKAGTMEVMAEIRESADMPATMPGMNH